jgi:hypothetical protein
MGNSSGQSEFLTISFWLLAIGLLSGCAKVETTRTNTTSNATTQTTIASDEVTVNNEFDNALDDAVTYLSNHEATFVHAYPDSISPYVYEINYAGKEANPSKSRAGNDSIHLGTLPWGTAGATATITFGDANALVPEYEVTFNDNNSSLRLVGNASVTNVYGGLLQNLAAGDSVVVHIRATIAFTYNDQMAGAQTFTWYLNQLRTFTMVDTNLLATTRGDTSISGSPNVGTWGTTRLGTSFYTVTNAIVVQNLSNPYLSYNPLSGSKSIDGISEPIYSFYGVNTSGGHVTSGTPYGFYINWNNSGTSTAIVIAYYY